MIHRSSRHIGQRNRTMRGLGLGLRRSRERVVVRRRLSLRNHLRHHHIDRAAILRMHAAQRLQRRGLLHHLEHQRVVNHQHARVSHEELETRNPLGDHLLHLAQPLRAVAGPKVRHGHV